MTNSEIANEIIKNHFKTVNILYTGDDSQRGEYYSYGVKRKGTWDEVTKVALDKHTDNTNPQANNATYNNVRTKVAVRTHKDAKMNNTPTLINLHNGMYDPFESKLKPHARDYYSTTQLDFEYKAADVCPKWLKFLDTMFYSDEEKTQIPLLQEFMGYSFLPDASFQKALVVHGVAHSAKSTLEKYWQKMLGEDTYTATALANISDKLNIYNFRNQLMNFCDETAENIPIHDATFKALVSGENVEGRAHFKMPEKYIPFIRFAIFTNHLPIITDSSEGIWRRLLLITLDKEIPTESRIRDYERFMFDEISGVFNWCMEGLRRLYRNDNFTIPDIMEKRLSEYKLESDPVSQFVLEYIIDEENYRFEGRKILKKVLYGLYCDWLYASNKKATPIGPRKFYGRVRARFNKDNDLITFEDALFTGGQRGFKIIYKGDGTERD